MLGTLQGDGELHGTLTLGLASQKDNTTWLQAPYGWTWSPGGAELFNTTWLQAPYGWTWSPGGAELLLSDGLFSEARGGYAADAGSFALEVPLNSKAFNDFYDYFGFKLYTYYY